MIGFSDINLKPLSNTNQKMINSSLDPIHLYQEERNVNDFKGNSTKGYFRVQLSYGTISQVQSLLNQNKPKRTEQPKTQVEVQNHLGIFVKENKQQK